MSKSRDFYREIKNSCHQQTLYSPINAENGAPPEAGTVPKWRGLYAGPKQLSANFYSLSELFCAWHLDLEPPVSVKI
jgi:hypothetical protein